MVEYDPYPKDTPLMASSIAKAGVDDSYLAGVVELENQLDRLVERLSNLEDRISIASYSLDLKNTDATPSSEVIMGKSDMGRRIWGNAIRLRGSINRLERITTSLDL